MLKLFHVKQTPVLRPSRECDLVSREVMCSTHEPLCQDFMRLLYAAFLPSHLQSTAIGKDNWRGTQKYCGFMFPTAPDAMAYGLTVFEFVLTWFLSTEETRKYGFEGCAAPPPSCRPCRALASATCAALHSRAVFCFT